MTTSRPLPAQGTAPMDDSKYVESRRLQAKSHALIPGGAHTYAKGDDQYPEASPVFIERGHGCRVWDVDGNEFIEYGMGLRTVTLGHAYEPVVEAAHRQMLLGANFSRPAKIEVEYAEEFLKLISGADMVKFAKNGSDVTTAAVKLARAYTGRDMVAVCTEHPFFSVDDWFIGRTENSSGIPQVIRDLTVTFGYNNIDSLKALFAKHADRIACIVMEAATTEEPRDGFLHKVKQLCEENGAVFILDEMITGFRWDLRGAQATYGITPDLSTFGKGIANGFALAALAGRREIMRLGGIEHDRERVFLLSTTHGAETHALAAAQETLRIYQQSNVVERLYRQGDRLRSGVQQSIARHELGGSFGIMGRSCNLIYATMDAEGRPSQAFRTLFLQELMKRGVIAPSFVVCFSHSDADIDQTVDIVDEALGVYKRALDEGIEKYLHGRPVKVVNRRYN